MKKKVVIIVAVFLSIFIWGPGCNDGSSKPPNILIISLDACRADHLSCYGYTRETSPFLDNLASQGVLFKNAFINTHGTPPSHLTILSSLYNQTHGLGGWFSPMKISPEIIMVQEILQDHGYITLSVTGGSFFKNYGFERGFTEFESTGVQTESVESGVKKVLGLVEKYSGKQKPIFVFFHTFSIHSPYKPPEEYKTIFGKYDCNFECSSKNLMKFLKKANKLSDTELEYIISQYDAGIKYTDDILKGLFENLETFGFFDNYLVIITADHGEEFGEHGRLLHTKTLYDELLCVPMIMTGSSIPKGHIDKRMVSSIDITPTILGFAGIKTDIHMEGQNLLLHNTGNNNQKEAVFAQYGSSLYSIRTIDWKLIETQKPYSVSLFDLKSDPGETMDVSEHHQEICHQLHKRLIEWRSSCITVDLLAKKREAYSDNDIAELESLGYVKE